LPDSVANANRPVVRVNPPIGPNERIAIRLRIDYEPSSFTNAIAFAHLEEKGKERYEKKEDEEVEEKRSKEGELLGAIIKFTQDSIYPYPYGNSGISGKFGNQSNSGVMRKGDEIEIQISTLEPNTVEISARAFPARSKFNSRGADLSSVSGEGNTISSNWFSVEGKEQQEEEEREQKEKKEQGSLLAFLPQFRILQGFKVPNPLHLPVQMALYLFEPGEGLEIVGSKILLPSLLEYCKRWLEN